MLDLYCKQAKLFAAPAAGAGSETCAGAQTGRRNTHKHRLQPKQGAGAQIEVFNQTPFLKNPSVCPFRRRGRKDEPQKTLVEAKSTVRDYAIPAAATHSIE
jgi:hypothetical protein